MFEHPKIDAILAELRSHDAIELTASILFGLVSILLISLGTLTKQTERSDYNGERWFACPELNGPKRAWEVFNFFYGFVWIAIFAIIVAFRLYERFDFFEYMVVCGGLCVPILASPIFFPSSEDKKQPILRRFGVRANLWMIVYSFIGNYWYTHYFYNVLKANYTMPSKRLNNVPIQLYFSTFFYFCFYHTLSNAVLRRITSTFRQNFQRKIFVCLSVFSMAYFTAFMESWTISSYPDYYFEDQFMAFTIGSAFYGLYFIVSFPMFYRFDEWPKTKKSPSLWETFVDSMGCGMIILMLLDIVRLMLGIGLTIE